MNGRKKSLIAAIAVAAIAGVCGCGASSVETKTEVHGIVSYMSTDSAVYSSTADVVAAVADSVVEIHTESTTTQWGMKYVVSGAGSGVIIGRDEAHGEYYIVTNDHVISGASEIGVRLRSGAEYTSQLVATDVAGDIAVIKISESSTLSVATWGNSDQLKIGEDLIAIGNPLGNLGGTVTKGILSASGRAIAIRNHTMTLLQTDTAINPGNSGGGLFNMRGELIGVVNAKTSDEEIEGICFAIPGNTARHICGELMEHGYVTGRASLGIEVTTGSLQGGTITYVADASNADSGTFARYDRIASINGAAITTLLSYNDALAAIEPGDSVSVTVYRGHITQSPWGSSVSFDSEPTSFTVTAKQLGNR